MNRSSLALVMLTLFAVVGTSLYGRDSQQQPPAVRMVDLRAADGTVLKATYFAAGKAGPGVLLLHQINRTRKAWDDVAVQLAAAGINTLTLDMRGFGESGGSPCAVSHPSPACDQMPGDLDAALHYLALQPGVEPDVIGVGGAGLLGVDNSVLTARRRSVQIKSLVLLSGETFQPGVEFLRQTPQLPGLFVVADDDEYPPTVEAMELLYISSSNPSKKFVHYSASHDAPWLWYEPRDVGKVPAGGGHGTDMFKTHRELPGIIVDWFVTTLIKTPGHAPADTVASASIIDQIQRPGGAAQVAQQLTEARQKDPTVQLFPEITVSIIGQDHMRVGESKLAVEVLKLDVVAYPDSADAHETVAEAYWRDGQTVLARQHAEKALALLDSHSAPASSWTDTEPYRAEIRRGAQNVLQKVSAAQVTAPAAAISGHVPGTVFRDCPDCPEMTVVPTGNLTMGSSASEKSWAASHGAKAEWVSDESPQHLVSLRSFAIGKYDVTRGEYAVFVRETGYPPGDGCGHDGGQWHKQAGVNWQNPGFSQTDRDPVVCVSWKDARAYVSWLHGKVRGSRPDSAVGAYRLPSESEWEYAARGGTTTRFWWGDDDAFAADHAWFEGNSNGQTHAVGFKPANPFGLFDMVGNVWQWTEDCYADSYADAPTDGMASEIEDACYRVDRGSSWFYPTWMLRPAVRERNPAEYRDMMMGFRVARTLQ